MSCDLIRCDVQTERLCSAFLLKYTTIHIYKVTDVGQKVFEGFG